MPRAVGGEFAAARGCPASPRRLVEVLDGDTAHSALTDGQVLL